MAAVSRPSQAAAAYVPIVPDDPPAPKPSVDAPEVAAVAATVCEFMNNERLRDLAQYVVRFGKQFVRTAPLPECTRSAKRELPSTCRVVRG